MSTFTDLLTQTCTIVTNTAGVQNGYGRIPYTAGGSTTGVACRFSRPRRNETFTTEGVTQQCDGKIFLDFAAVVGMHDRIKDIKDAGGSAVIDGTFEVVDIFPCYAGSTGHHKEVLVSRA